MSLLSSAYDTFWDFLGYGVAVPTALLSVFNGWSTWFQGIMAFLGSASAALFWTLIGRHVLCWLQWYFCWLLRLIFAWTLSQISPVLHWMPAIPPLVLDPLVNSWRILNYWGPLNETVAGFGIAFFIVFVFRSIRFIKQFIPTASN